MLMLHTGEGLQPDGSVILPECGCEIIVIIILICVAWLNPLPFVAVNQDSPQGEIGYDLYLSLLRVPRADCLLGLINGLNS